MIFSTVFAGSKPEAKYADALYIYMCGSNLETKLGAATKNIAEMLSANVPKNTAIIIETGGTQKWRDYDISSEKLSRYKVENGRLELISTLPGENMGIESTLTDFLTFASNKYSAKRAGVILWNHGSGSSDGICYDERYDMDGLSLSELDGAFANSGIAWEHKLDFIGFDACLMANYETALIANKYAENMIASEEIESASGWDYKRLIENIGGDDFYESVLNGYKEKCEKNKKNAYTLSHIKLSGVENISKKFDEFVDLIDEKSKDNKLKDVVKAAEKSMSFGANSDEEGYSNLIDLADFGGNLGYGELNSVIESAVNVVNGSAREGAGGLSLYYPFSSVKNVDKYLENTPLDKYKAYLKKNYSDVGNRELIKYSDSGSKVDGELSVEITDDSQNYVNYFSYRVLMFVENNEQKHQRVIVMGEDDDVVKTDRNRYKTHFAGRWAMWNGEVLNTSAIDINDDVTIFATPAKVNGRIGTIRFAYKIKNQEFTILGFIPKIYGTEMNRIETIAEKSKITLMYEESDENQEKQLYEGKTFEYSKNNLPRVEYLNEGYYQVNIIAHDIFGREYTSGTAVVKFANGKTQIVAVTHDKITS